jgi:FixJ family two-component response regulator
MISVIDDDRSVREAVQSLIRSLGYEVAAFSCAEDYLKSEYVGHFKCVISDVQMPGMNGIDLQHRLAEDGYDTPIILMSALAAGEISTYASKVASCQFLRKPFSDERLIQCLDSALKDTFIN